MIYLISDSPWVVVATKENELIPTCLVTGWRVCIDYRKLNEATRKDHFPLPFMDQMLERLAENEFYCFLDGFSGYFQIPIEPQDQEKTTFTCPYGTFTYRCMPFGLCNPPDTFQRCMMAIFHDMIEKTMEVFMDDFSVFGDSFDSCLSNLEKMLKRCEDTNLVLNWEKCTLCVEKELFKGGGGEGGRGVKEKHNGLSNDTVKDNVVMSPAVDEPMVAFGNNKGTKDGNEGQGVIPIITTASNTGSVPITVHESPNTDNSALIRSRPTSADVAIPLDLVRTISERFAKTGYGFFWGKRVAYHVFSSKDELDAMLENGPWFIRNNPFILIKWNPDTKRRCWSSYARVMTELPANAEFKDTIMVAMPKLVGEGFNMCNIRVEYECKPFRQATRGVLVGRHVSFKSTKQIYTPVSNNNDANTSGKKKQAKVSRQEVGNSNPFDALNSIKNDDKLAKRIDKFERQLTEEKLLLVDDDEKPLPKVVSTVNADIDSEVEEETKHDDDDHDPYDDDLYDSHDMSNNFQAICDEFDVTVHDWKKK
ncbi:reverse transcriptase domain-containing protein [Tanacetum coccineum]